MTNITCTLTFEGQYPTSEYPEFVQNVTLVAVGAGSIATVSIMTLLVLMVLALLV